MTLDNLFASLRDDYRWGDIIPISLQPNHKQLLVITGENASGKSILRRIISSRSKEGNTEVIAISPELKQMGGIRNAFIYGDESYQASGEIQCGMVLKSIKTSRSRTSPHVIIIDELDAYLSDNAAAGVAQEIAEYCKNASEHLRYFAIITHRKSILEIFLEAGASHIRVGDDLTLQQFVNCPVIPIRPQEIIDRSRRLFHAITPRLKKD